MRGVGSACLPSYSLCCHGISAGVHLARTRRSPQPGKEELRSCHDLELVCNARFLECVFVYERLGWPKSALCTYLVW
jgi:hypothetical protein